MNQGHRRHGGRSYTLLYYIGLGGKEGGQKDKSKEEKRNGGQKDKRTEKRKGKGRQKDKRTEKKGKGKGKGRLKDRRTEEKGKGKGRQKDKGTEKRAGNLQLPSLFDATYFVTVLYGDFCLLY